jgi:hypothetical protein
MDPLLLPIVTSLLCLLNPFLVCVPVLFLVHGSVLFSHCFVMTRHINPQEEVSIYLWLFKPFWFILRLAVDMYNVVYSINFFYTIFMYSHLQTTHSNINFLYVFTYFLNYIILYNFFLSTDLLYMYIWFEAYLCLFLLL